MDAVVALLAQNPLLTLFLVAGIGYPLGRLKVAGVSVGVAAVLFVGLAVGALDASIQLPEILQTLGLVMFVYTLGLSSGPGFVAAFRKRGAQASVLTLSVLGLAVVLWWVLDRLLHLPPALAAGGFTGSLTNTAALAAVIELTGGSLDPAVGYSITYPMGVLGLMMVMMAASARFRAQGRLLPPPKPGFITRTIRVTNPAVLGRGIGEIAADQTIGVIFGRIRRGDRLMVAESSIPLELEDLITAVGPPDEMGKMVVLLGEETDERLEFDRREYDFRRVIISNPSVFGKALGELQLPQKHDAIVTRVSRGDVEFLPDGTTILEPGDRVRVVTHRDNMAAINKLLGDSYKALSEVDILSFALGICLGLLLGMVAVPLPGGISFKLGVAGGPLVMSLVLGALHRTGPIHWGLSFNANLTLRQIGLILFLAGVGVRSGFAFKEALMQPSGWIVFAVGLLVTVTTATSFLLLASRVFKVSGANLLGMVAAVHTQPAALGFATDQTKSDAPNVGYATVFPIASVSKIILAQVLYQILK